jgi:uncharacterized membrane protein YadS
MTNQPSPANQNLDADNAGPSVKRGPSEDYWANVLGVLAVLAGMLAVALYGSSVTGWIYKPGEWESNPIDAFWGSKGNVPVWGGTMMALGIIGLLMSAVFVSQRNLVRGLLAYLGIALLAVLAMVMSGQSVIKYYNLEYVLWALLVGWIIGNTIGIPKVLRPAVRGELFIKIGLVLLGMEVLMGKLWVLGVPGVMVSWVVTPIVLITTFWFGHRILRIGSPSLTMTIAADMSVCGVSAAIATASACRAKKEELSLAISLSLAFTAVMMVVMPIVIRLIGMDDIVGGAWLGGTIDSTGAVAAAGAALGDRALKIAGTVKMIQNVLIGVIAFGVSSYWAAKYGIDAERSDQPRRGFFSEVWARFPKFVLGFLAVSVVASLIDWSGPEGAGLVKASIDLVTKELRNWLFCIAFICIGMEMQMSVLWPALKGGKPMVLYLVGQSFNLILTGLMASWVFGSLYREAIMEWLEK